MPHIEAAIDSDPAFGAVGIKKVYNGAIAYSPSLFHRQCRIAPTLRQPGRCR